MSGDALVWMIAVDMAFLLEFLQVYSVKEECQHLNKITSGMSHLVDVTGKKLSHVTILRDVVMVENQIPLFLLRTMMEHQFKKLTNGEVKSADETLKTMLLGLYHELTPFHEKGLVKYFKKLIFGKPMALLMKLPWKIISNLPLLKLVKEPAERMLEKFQGGGDDKPEEKTEDPKVPTIEEITIPSVTELVYLRNVVAYEACVAAGPLVVARYTELMNRIIDTEEDAKYLRERGIVLNHLKSDKEVADLWNGMSKSVKLTKVAKMDKVIEDVNTSRSALCIVVLVCFISSRISREDLNETN
ncbi:hypothetical protein L1987_87245 [Smallanthus sonchifolius]|nr:hypothetical protein L1987_87245 [Smallanthus sonchifolius]